MTLREVSGRLEEFEGGMVIYAERVPDWTGSSRAVVAPAGDDREGLTYLLEVDLAREAIRVWSAWREGLEPDEDQRLEAVTHYALHDSFLPASR